MGVEGVLGLIAYRKSLQRGAFYQSKMALIKRLFKVGPLPSTGERKET